MHFKTRSCEFYIFKLVFVNFIYIFIYFSCMGHLNRGNFMLTSVVGLSFGKRSFNNHKVER